MGRPSSSPQPRKRQGIWYLIRRVPKAMADVEPRHTIFLTTGIPVTDDPKGIRARQVVARLNAEVETRWRDMRYTPELPPEEAYKAAVTRARVLGIEYLPAANVSALPIDQLVDRIALLGNPTEQSDMAIASVLGAVSAPAIRISDLPSEVERIDATTFARKSARQQHKWRVARTTYARTFVDALGEDKPIEAITRQDILTLRTLLQARVTAGEISVDTANTVIKRLSAMLTTVNETHQLNLPPLFAKARLKGGETNQRKPYDIAFIQDRLLQTGALDDLNPEARRVVYLMIETGLRLSEACNLGPSTIDLTSNVPHIKVRAEGRQLKTAQSMRDIPLVGVALMAMREHPTGFPRYHDKADSLSAIINKVLAARGLRPNGETVYSLRHTFKDRLRAIGATDELKDVLMGHKRDEPAYGFGYSLESKAEVLTRMAFRPPLSV